MTTDEIIKANAILILEQKKEIEDLKKLLYNISRELPEDYTDLENLEQLPDLARYWVDKAETLQRKWEGLRQELRGKWGL